jgi:peptidoglycan hydrolase-like protein with peptidoglycan-binding domain
MSDVQLAPTASTGEQVRRGAPGATTSQRTLLGTGARGDLVQDLQAALAAHGLYRGPLDGDYGDVTAKAVRAFRRRANFPAAAAVDAPTWRQATKRPVPTVRDRALQLTAAFEGHGFRLAQGNFDGAGLTWGVIGFTLASGQVPAIVLAVESSAPHLVGEAFGKKAPELLTMLHAPWSRQRAWAQSLTLGGGRLAEPWRTAFWRFGGFPAVQAIQLEHVDGYFHPAQRDAQTLGFKTELGLALCFDIHVQNGSIGTGTMRRLKTLQAQHKIKDERELRVLLAQAVADAANPTYRADVLSRKLTVATGVGHVHGATYVLRNWGLAEVPVRAAAPPSPRRRP